MKSRSRALAAAFATCAIVAGAPATAGAASTVSKLRVEAAGHALDPGTSYVNGTATLATWADQCGGSGKSKRVIGPTAMGIVDYAKQVNRTCARSTSPTSTASG
jgi:hypothetical protein